MIKEKMGMYLEEGICPNCADKNNVIPRSVIMREGSMGEKKVLVCERCKNVYDKTLGGVIGSRK